MTPAERAAMRELEVAEQAVRRAVAMREIARERLELVMRRECRHRQSTRAQLRLVVGARRQTTQV
jgi:hypothetical protein